MVCFNLDHDMQKLVSYLLESGLKRAITYILKSAGGPGWTRLWFYK